MTLEGQLLLKYLNMQFPATVGHKQLEAMITCVYVGGLKDVLEHCENTEATGIQGMCAISNIEHWIRQQIEIASK